jgi:hypothetical protein
MSKLKHTVAAAVAIAAVAGPATVASAAGKPSARALPTRHAAVHRIATPPAAVASCYVNLPAVERAQLVGMPCP